MGAQSVRFSVDPLKPGRMAPLRILSVSSPSSPLRQHTSYPKSPYPKTAYVQMLLQLEEIPVRYNILACFFTWLALAGYIFLPGTFTSIQHSDAFKHGKLPPGSKSLQRIPLLWFSTICCVTGVVGASWLWMVFKGNYIWLINRLFVPTIANSSVGLVTTLINVYTVRDGSWSIVAIVTAATTGIILVSALVLYLSYTFISLERVKREHHQPWLVKE